MSIDYRGVPGHYGNFGALEQYVGNQPDRRARRRSFTKPPGQTRTLLECTPVLLAEAAAQGDAGGAATLGGNGRDARRGACAT